MTTHGYRNIALRLYGDLALLLNGRSENSIDLRSPCSTSVRVTMATDGKIPSSNRIHSARIKGNHENILALGRYMLYTGIGLEQPSLNKGKCKHCLFSLTSPVKQCASIFIHCPCSFRGNNHFGQAISQQY